MSSDLCGESPHKLIDWPCLDGGHVSALHRKDSPKRAFALPHCDMEIEDKPSQRGTRVKVSGSNKKQRRLARWEVVLHSQR
jgi:hypothetical protein